MAILFSCSCGKQLQAKEEFAGRRIKCPACTQVVAIPGQPTLGPEATSNQPTVTHQPVILENEPAAARGEPRPDRTVSLTRRRALWPWVAAAFLLAVAAGFGLWFFVFRGKPAELRTDQTQVKDVDFVPTDGAMFASFRLGHWWSSDAGIRFRQQLAALNPGNEIEKSIGIPPQDIERIMVVWSLPAEVQFVFATSKPYDQARVLATERSGHVPQPVNNKVLHVSAQTNMAFYFANPSVFLYGSVPEMKKLLREPVSRSGMLSDAVRLADGHVFVAAVNLTEPQFRRLLHPTSAGPEAKPKLPLVETRTIVLTTKMAYFLASPRAFLYDMVPAIQKLRHERVSLTGMLTEALRQADRHPFVAAVKLTEPQFRKLLHPTSRGPEAIPFLPLLEAQTIVLTTDLGENLRIELRLTFPDETRAEKGEKSVHAALARIQQYLADLSQMIPPDQKEVGKPFFHLANSMLQGVRVEREQSAVHLRLQTDNEILARALDSVNPAVEATRRTESQNNLKELALAMANYDSAHKALPQAVFHKGLSWRVAILPYIGEDRLYKEFHLEEPWDSPHNIKLLHRMPRVFRSPVTYKKVGVFYMTGRVDAKDLESTHCKVFTGPHTPFHSAKSLSLQDFRDGRRNTFLIVEAGKKVPWTKPEDIPYDPKVTLPSLLGPYPGGFYAVLGDGSVRWISEKVSEKTIRAAITPAGGEVLGPDWKQ